jgi:hypothetical protein
LPCIRSLNSIGKHILALLSEIAEDKNSRIAKNSQFILLNTQRTPTEQSTIITRQDMTDDEVFSTLHSRYNPPQLVRLRNLDTEVELDANVDVAGHLYNFGELDGLLGCGLQIVDREDFKTRLVDLEFCVSRIAAARSLLLY